MAFGLSAYLRNYSLKAVSVVASLCLGDISSGRMLEKQNVEILVFVNELCQDTVVDAVGPSSDPTNRTFKLSTRNCAEQHARALA